MPKLESADLRTAGALQEATSEILRLIAARPGELQVVLDAILARAVELCDGDAGAMTFARDGTTG